MLDHEEYSQSSMGGDDIEVYSTCMNSQVNMRKKKSKINKRRFSDEQIKSLESIFENESRLEPRKKLLLARELGLQPRQVAIWFQNKRARWKSKQIEKDYSTLRANYNSLVTRYEALKKEKQSLVMQLQQLNERLGKPQEDSQVCAQAKTENSMDSAQSYNGDAVTHEAEVKARWTEEGEVEHGRLAGVLSDCDSKIKAEYFSLEEGSELLDLMDPGEGSMTSTEDWDKFKSDGLLDQSASGSPWWDFWS